MVPPSGGTMNSQIGFEELNWFLLIDLILEPVQWNVSGPAIYWAKSEVVVELRGMDAGEPLITNPELQCRPPNVIIFTDDPLLVLDDHSLLYEGFYFLVRQFHIHGE